VLATNLGRTFICILSSKLLSLNICVALFGFRILMKDDLICAFKFTVNMYARRWVFFFNDNFGLRMAVDKQHFPS